MVTEQVSVMTRQCASKGTADMLVERKGEVKGRGSSGGVGKRYCSKWKEQM